MADNVQYTPASMSCKAFYRIDKARYARVFSGVAVKIFRLGRAETKKRCRSTAFYTPSRARTADKLIKSQLLYQLS